MKRKFLRSKRRIPYDDCVSSIHVKCPRFDLHRQDATLHWKLLQMSFYFVFLNPSHRLLHCPPMSNLILVLSISYWGPLITTHDCPMDRRRMMEPIVQVLLFSLVLRFYFKKQLNPVDWWHWSPIPGTAVVHHRRIRVFVKTIAGYVCVLWLGYWTISSWANPRTAIERLCGFGLDPFNNHR